MQKYKMTDNKGSTVTFHLPLMTFFLCPKRGNQIAPHCFECIINS